MTEYITGVSNVRITGSSNGVYRRGHKKYWTIYFLDENGNFRTRRTNIIGAAWARIHKLKKKDLLRLGVIDEYGRFNR